MLAPDNDLFHEKIGNAAKLIAERIGGKEGEAAASFCELFYAHAPADDVIAHEPEALYRQALSIFKLAARRKPGAPALRVFNPNLSDDGWRSGHTVVEIVQDDMPFLVDSITSALNAAGLSVHLIIHPVLRLERQDGVIVACAGQSKDGKDESLMQFHIDERSDAKALADLEQTLTGVLESVQYSVADWADMRKQVASAIESLALRPPKTVAASRVQEAADFLSWLDDDHFTFLGYRAYIRDASSGGFKADVESGLGLLRAGLPTASTIMQGIDSIPSSDQTTDESDVLNVLKSASRSPVHRPAPLDYVSADIYDESGEVVGQHRFVGLFTSTVYTTSPSRIPILRRKVVEVVDRAAAGRGSHDKKALTHILDTYPRDELLQVNADELTRIAGGILNLQERQRTALFTRRDAFDRFVAALVYVPRDRYDTELRLKMADILAREYKGDIASFATHIGDEPLARVYFTITTPAGAANVDIASVEAKLKEASRSWADQLEEALISERGEEQGLALFRKYGDAFPAAYRDATSADMAALDITLIETHARPNGLGLDLLHPLEARPSEVHFKLFHAESPAPLSDVLPMLEAMGLRILTETPTEVRATGETPIFLHYFVATTADGQELDVRKARPLFLDAFARIWRGEADNDDFNRLILGGGLDWRRTALLRAFSHYLRQAQAAFSIDYMQRTLNAHSGIASQIVDVFEARLEPDKADPADAAKARQGVLDALDGVASLDEDRILRRFLNLAEVAQRTNFWQPGADGAPKSYISIKFDSAAVEDLPLPRPMAEIFVFSPRMEGIHLRGGKVARGGIRWSDRQEDFRTEILGLMKAQMVKNTVIVPVGAKGGFIVKRPPTTGGREAFQAEGVECYKTLIRGMLDVTDNYVDGKVVGPNRVARPDGDDPYIVAAADKGTATFSDIANGISADYGYWLGDAFASGGSAGYDHKKMGITARGAWESVKRMFLELGKDIQNEPFTVVGCGDMSGDVFGNGMLLSRQIKLLGAFNHMHILVDPDPDPATSWAERSRMFDLPRSAWSDYDQSKLSKGGAIFERSAKSITLSPEAQAAFDAPQAKLTPNELINIMLKAPAELLWFGGIGNYIKAEDESQAAAGDRANDTIRVNGNEVRAKVVGEGANLGVTQLGRVEFAQNGGRINADFIDNSAGVDASDHEVNLKILLGEAVAEGDMTGKQRDVLLAEMTEEVGHLILRNNYLQGQALSIAEATAPAQLADHIRFMRTLERDGRLNRAVEYLPDDEMLAEREAAGLGLTRPELAVLLSYAKLDLYDQLVASDVSDDPGLAQRLLDYFPGPARAAHKERIGGHRLAREITSTLLTNEAVDRMGFTFVRNMADRYGRPPSDVARAFAISVDAFDLSALMRRVEAQDGPGRFPIQAEMFGEISRLIRRTTGWLLRRQDGALEIDRLVADLQPSIAIFAENLTTVLGPDATERVAARGQRWVEAGADKDLAIAIAQLDPIAAAPDISQIAASAEPEDLLSAARIYFQASAQLRLGLCRQNARGIVPGTAWERQALDAILEDLYGHQTEIARHAAAEGGLDAWSASRQAAIDRLGRTLDEMLAADKVSLAMITVANSMYRGLSAA